MVNWLLPLMAMAACGLAEVWHGRRLRRMAKLAFGPAGRPRSWVVASPPMRIAAAGAACWGLLVLWQFDATPWNAASPPTVGQGSDERNMHHLVLALDVSPSMELRDAGPNGSQSRGERARDLLRNLLQRLDAPGMRVSILAFFHTARPVVIDTFDPEVVANILYDLPLEHAFSPGKTNLYAGVQAANDLAQPWKPQSTTLMLVSDGDSLPPEKPPQLPPAVGSVLIVGVGDPYRGQFLDGHSSRQDAGSLERLALRLGGAYHDGNSRYIPTAEIEHVLASLPGEVLAPSGWNEAAIWSTALASAVLALISPALALAGSPWARPAGRRERHLVWNNEIGSLI